MLRELEKVVMETENVVVSTDVGNISAVANGYTQFKRPTLKLSRPNDFWKLRVFVACYYGR